MCYAFENSKTNQATKTLVIMKKYNEQDASTINTTGGTNNKIHFYSKMHKKNDTEDTRGITTIRTY